LHGIAFETIFAIFALVFIMFYKQISIVDAFFMEIFFLAFFLIYTVVYTYIYDMARGILLMQIHTNSAYIIDDKKV